MYRQGLGDCFLITFDVGGDEKHMLIDCGTLGATTTGVKLEEVVADIRTTTGESSACLDCHARAPRSRLRLPAAAERVSRR